MLYFVFHFDQYKLFSWSVSELIVKSTALLILILDPKLLELFWLSFFFASQTYFAIFTIRNRKYGLFESFKISLRNHIKHRSWRAVFVKAMESAFSFFVKELNVAVFINNKNVIRKLVENVKEYSLAFL